MKVLEGYQDGTSQTGREILDKVLKVLSEADELDEVDWDTSIAQTDYGTVTPELLIGSFLEALLMYQEELEHYRDVHKARGNKQDVRHFKAELERLNNFQKIKQNQLGDRY